MWVGAENNTEPESLPFQWPETKYNSTDPIRMVACDRGRRPNQMPRTEFCADAGTTVDVRTTTTTTTTTKHWHMDR